jgi:hypothetical protein
VQQAAKADARSHALYGTREAYWRWVAETSLVLPRVSSVDRLPSALGALLLLV